MKETLIILAAFAAASVSLTAVVLKLGQRECYAQWVDSGYRARWDAFGGCRVQRKDGTWVPAKMMREINP